MSYLVIARKWRPQSFSDVAGQQHITRTLQNAIKADRVAHAFLFTGVRGVGKTTAARILAKALNCAKGPTPDPCNECSPCREIAQGSSIDVLEIDGASNRGIDEIRQIIENARYQPANCRFKIYIIDEVHQVTKDAFNALLKTLEEPPPAVKFILATTEPHRLPATILSRCQRYDFRRIGLREIVERLAAIARSERLDITDGALVLLAREADGSMRDAQSLLEQVFAIAAPAGVGGKQQPVDENSLEEILGLVERRMLYQVSAAILAGDSRRCVELVAEAVNQGRDVSRFARDLVEHFRNLLVARLIGSVRGTGAGDSNATRLLDLPDQEIADLREQAGSVSVETLLDYLDFMAAGEEQIARSATPRFALESVLVRLAGLPKTLPVAALIERLERLEGKAGSGTIKPVTSRAAETTAPIAPAETNPTRIDPPSVGGLSRSWPEFLALVRSEKKLLAYHLEAGTPLELPPGRLRIGISERHHLAFLLDRDNLATLKEQAGRFFAEEVNVQIVNQIDAGPALSEAAGPDERSPMVKEALRIFGGSVRNVRKETP
jgi:DNA polymerase-3 subunit gamma/tau